LLDLKPDRAEFQPRNPQAAGDPAAG
jgi:hypothetical protein